MPLHSAPDDTVDELDFTLFHSYEFYDELADLSHLRQLGRGCGHRYQ